MKKILSVLLVLVLVAGTAFAAAPTFTGNFGYGYLFGFNGVNAAYNALGDTGNNYAGYLYLKASTDYIDIDFRGEADADHGDEGNDVAGLVRANLGVTGTFKLSNLINDVFETELPVTLTAYVGNQSLSAKDSYAYSDPASGDDEIGLNGARSDMPIGISVAYQNYITVNAYADFIGTGNTAGKVGLVEVLSNPVDGIKLQVAYGVGQADLVSDFQAAALVDVAALAGLDFSLDVSGYMEADLDNFSETAVAKGAVTGGYDAVGLYAEYTYKSAQAKTDGDTYAGHTLYLGGSYSFDFEKAPLVVGLDTAVYDLAGSPFFGAAAYADTVLGGVEFYTELGVNDFSDVKNTGYVCVASAISF